MAAVGGPSGSPSRRRRVVAYCLLLALIATLFCLRTRLVQGSPRAGAAAGTELPVLVFGVVADLQYDEAPNGLSAAGADRYFRRAPSTLASAVDQWNAWRPRIDFAVNLGDSVDFHSGPRTETQLNALLQLFARVRAPVFHCRGNHDLFHLDRQTLRGLLDPPGVRLEVDDEVGINAIPRADYFATTVRGFRLIFLDSFEVSMLGWPTTDQRYIEAKVFLERNNPNEDKNKPPAQRGMRRRFTMFNGAVGPRQLRWLGGQLERAERNGLRALVFTHTPVAPGLRDPVALLWNYGAVLGVLHAHRRAVAAVIAGHFHPGGIVEDEKGIPHITLRGAIECNTSRSCFGVIVVKSHKLILHGYDGSTIVSI